MTRLLRLSLGGLVAICVALLATGFVYETISEMGDARAFPPPGQMVDVGGRSLHITCVGQGSPTVILESGLGTSSSAWGLVQPVVSTSTRTCAYDRAGMGWSPVGPEPRDARQVSLELHALLQKAGLPGPYVMVGHSNGGLYARMYAALYPGDVAALVLLDPTPADLLTRLPSTRPGLVSAGQQAATMSWLARFGLARLLVGPAVRTEMGAFSSAEREAVVASRAATQYWRALDVEVASMETSMAEVAQAGGLGDRPLLVLSSTEGAPSADEARTKIQLYDEIAALSTNGSQQIVEGATHQGLATTPEHAAIASAAISHVVEAVRGGQLAASEFERAATRAELISE